MIRVWLPDRPGSLGVLATCLGGLGGEIVGIDILERAGDRAVDELTVDIAGPEALGPLTEAVRKLEGFDVEDVRPLVSRLPFPGADPLDAAVAVVDANSPGSLFEVVVRSVASVFSSDWASVVDLEIGSPATVASAGSAPGAGWLGAFVSGARAASGLADSCGAWPRDVAGAPLDDAQLVLVTGRDGPPFRARERRELTVLASLADARWRELALRIGMRSHPSSTGWPATAS